MRIRVVEQSNKTTSGLVAYIYVLSSVTMIRHMKVIRLIKRRWNLSQKLSPQIIKNDFDATWSQWTIFVITLLLPPPPLPFNLLHVAGGRKKQERFINGPSSRRRFTESAPSCINGNASKKRLLCAKRRCLNRKFQNTSDENNLTFFMCINVGIQTN